MAFKIRIHWVDQQQCPAGAAVFAWLLTGLRRSGNGVLLTVAVIALTAVAVPTATWAQGDKATPNKQADTKPEYGDQGGEKVLPANSRLPNAVMRARLEDTFFKISNPRLGTASVAKSKGPKGVSGGKALLVDYEVVSKGKLESGTFLVLRASDGSKAEVALTSLAGRDSGSKVSVNPCAGRGKVARRVSRPGATGREGRRPVRTGKRRLPVCGSA